MKSLEPLFAGKKLLQVSDYITLFWWIEMFIFNIGNYLKDYWVTTKFLGLTLPLSLLKKLKVFFLPFTACNVISATQIISYSLFRKPDIIWFHGVSRYHGRLPIWCTKIFSSKKFMMYHDLWYFHPFPSTITEEDQVLPRSYTNRIRMSEKAKKLRSEKANKKLWFEVILFSKIAICLKFLGTALLRWILLSTIDKHLVPSEFMVQYLIDWGIEKSSIIVLPHFIVGKS